MLQQRMINLIHRTAICNLKLIIALVLNIFHMASDTGADTGRNFRGSNIHQMIPDTFAFPGRNRNACKWHKQAVSTDYLKQLTVVLPGKVSSALFIYVIFYQKVFLLCLPQRLI